MTDTEIVDAIMAAANRQIKEPDYFIYDFMRDVKAALAQREKRADPNAPRILETDIDHKPFRFQQPIFDAINNMGKGE